MPTPKPDVAALSEALRQERIDEVREVCDDHMHFYPPGNGIGRRAETVLALLAEREEARRHILIARDNLRADGNPYAAVLTAWLDGNRSTEEGEKL